MTLGSKSISLTFIDTTYLFNDLHNLRIYVHSKWLLRYLSAIISYPSTYVVVQYIEEPSRSANLISYTIQFHPNMQVV